MTWRASGDDCPQTCLEVGPLSPPERAASFIEFLLQIAPDAEIRLGGSQGERYTFQLAASTSTLIRAMLQSSDLYQPPCPAHRRTERSLSPFSLSHWIQLRGQSQTNQLRRRSKKRRLPLLPLPSNQQPKVSLLHCSVRWSALTLLSPPYSDSSLRLR